MKLLVTGATGHVGLELARQATRRGMSVVAPYRGELPAATAAAAGPGVEWLACDLADAAAVDALTRSRPIERCIHAAAISNEAYARPAPLDAIQTNVGATANLLEAARTGQWRRLVLVSTGSVFQQRSDLVTPILEDQPPRPANVYSTTKTCAEGLVRMFRSEYGMQASTVRISWVYGPPVASRSPTRGPIPSFLVRALNGEAIRESGADFAASFTYIADVAEGLLAAATAPELRHDVYHLGSGVNYTTGEVAQAVNLKFAPDIRFMTDESFAETERIAERWRPHRGVAARLLWAYYKVAKDQRSGTPV